MDSGATGRPGGDLCMAIISFEGILHQAEAHIAYLLSNLLEEKGAR